MLISIDLAKRSMDIEANTDDNFLTEIIEMVNARIDTYLNQNIIAQSNTHYFTGNNDVYYIVPYFPVNSITSLHYRALPSESWVELISGTDFFPTSEAKNLTKLFYNMGFYHSYEYKLVFNSGFADIPADVKHVALEMVKVAYDSTAKGKDRLGVGSLSVNKGNISETTQFIDLTTKWKTELSSYRVPVI